MQSTKQADLNWRDRQLYRVVLNGRPVQGLFWCSYVPMSGAELALGFKICKTAFLEPCVEAGIDFIVSLTSSEMPYTPGIPALIGI